MSAPFPKARPIQLAFVVALLVTAAACSSGTSTPSSGSGEWPTLSANLARTGANPNETAITKDNVAKLVTKWQFPTQGPVPASPVVATVNVPGQGAVRLVVVGSYDGNVYAIRASDGKEQWRFSVKPQPGVGYGLISSTATIAEVAGKQRVFVAGGETMYALDAATGQPVWQFDAGTGCTTCDATSERNEITSSPAVLPDQDLVLFGMDTNDRLPGKGGFFAVSAKDGRLRWYFDDAGATCKPDAGDNIRHFDGFHTEAQLSLPVGFLSSRSGCNFDRTETACGNIWSPVSADTTRKLIYFTTGNCDTSTDPTTHKPPPPMPKYDEAVVALHFDGTPAWTWRPREVDNNDLDFGTGPNLFTVTIQNKTRDVLGVGGKDGTYYLLDRDGKNQSTGRVEPYWQRNLVQGSDSGGITGTAAVVGDTIFVGTAISQGEAPVWAISAADGSVRWSQPKGAPFYGAASAVPGVVFMAGVDFQLHAYDASTGDILATLPLQGLGFSQAAIVNGEVFVGSGFGTLNEVASGLAKVPAAVWAFCIAGQAGCQSGAAAILR
jgi:polyvinyl alcohol dehydrogenase (cytochrome)